MERACYLSTNDVLTESDLGLTSWDITSTTAPVAADPASRQAPGAAISLGDATRDFQVAHIQQVIDRHRGNMTVAAEALGLHRSNLYRKMRQLGMKADDDQATDA